MNLAGIRNAYGTEIVFIKKNDVNRYEVAHGIVNSLTFTESSVGTGKGLVNITVLTPTINPDGSTTYIPSILSDGSTEYATKDMSLVFALAQEAIQKTKCTNVNAKLDEADALVLALGG